MENANYGSILCPLCGGNSFKQDVLESYYRYIDGKGNVIRYDDDFDKDVQFGVIRCEKCDADCSKLFADIEIDL